MTPAPRATADHVVATIRLGALAEAVRHLRVAFPGVALVWDALEAVLAARVQAHLAALPHDPAPASPRSPAGRVYVAARGSSARN